MPVTVCWLSFGRFAARLALSGVGYTRCRTRSYDKGVDGGMLADALADALSGTLAGTMPGTLEGTVMARMLAGNMREDTRCFLDDDDGTCSTDMDIGFDGGTSSGCSSGCCTGATVEKDKPELSE